MRTPPGAQHAYDRHLRERAEVVTRVARAGARVRARGLGLVEVRVGDVESFEAGLGLGERDHPARIAGLRERLSPQTELGAAVGRVAVRAVDEGGDVVRHRNERVEPHRVADRPRGHDDDGHAERDRDSHDPGARREVAQQYAQRNRDHDTEQGALGAGQCGEPDGRAERDEASGLRIVVRGRQQRSRSATSAT